MSYVHLVAVVLPHIRPHRLNRSSLTRTMNRWISTMCKSKQSILTISIPSGTCQLLIWNKVALILTVPDKQHGAILNDRDGWCLPSSLYEQALSSLLLHCSALWGSYRYHVVDTRGGVGNNHNFNASSAVTCRFLCTNSSLSCAESYYTLARTMHSCLQRPSFSGQRILRQLRANVQQAARRQVYRMGP